MTCTTPMTRMFPISAIGETHPAPENTIEFPPQRTLKEFA